MRAALIVAFLVFTLSFALAQDSPRALKPQFKGVELYSWKDTSSDTWQFSLLPGTNRLKTLGEITDKSHVIAGLPSLKQRLATQAKGEQIFWVRRSSLRQFAYPSRDTVAEVVRFAAEHNVTVVVDNQ
jgi:hypothetical protein